MVLTGTEQGLYFENLTDAFVFGFSGLGSGAVEGEIKLAYWFDGNRSSGKVGLGATLTPDVEGIGEWRVVTENASPTADSRPLLLKAKSVSFAYQDEGKEHVETFKLNNAALTALFECARR